MIRSGSYTVANDTNINVNSSSLEPVGSTLLSHLCRYSIPSLEAIDPFMGRCKEDQGRPVTVLATIIEPASRSERETYHRNSAAHGSGARGSARRLEVSDSGEVGLGCGGMC
jgi:hypothetical protein